MTDTPKRRRSQERADRVLAAYADGIRHFHEVDLAGTDLSNQVLTGASFLGGNLRGVNLSGCMLTHVQLKSADLREANLTGSAINATDLIGANFARANLAGADLTGAALFQADLSGADLSETNLGGADLEAVTLKGSRLRGAYLFHTILCNLDVSAFCDEQTLEQGGPSSIDHRTVLKSYQHPRLREFMDECGVPPLFSEFMIECARAADNNLLRELMQSTFVSYGGPDERFARRLHEALRARGVVTFFFPQNATVGARIGNEVFEQIQEYDRVLLVCSRRGLDRPGVINEIQQTFDREARDGGATYLLPITLDDYVLKDWHAVQPALAERVASRVIGDFRGTRRSNEKFDAALDRVLEALRRVSPKIPF